MARSIVVLAALLSAPAMADGGPGWSPRDRAWLGLQTAALVIDWGQTRRIAAEPHRWSETNPLLPRQPTMGQVNQHFLISGAVLTGLAVWSPWWRRNVMPGIAMMQIGVVSRNHIHVGIRMSW